MSYSVQAPVVVKPRTVAFLIPVGIFLLGLVLMAFLIFNGFRRAEGIVDDFDRVAVGESETFNLDESGYRVWLEGSGVDDRFEFVDYSIVSADNGDEVTTSPFSTSQTYTLGGRTGAALETFDLEESGAFEVSFLSTSSGDSDRDLAIGRDNPVRAIASGIVFGMGAAVAGFLVALVITIVLFVKRGRSKRAQTGPPQPGPPPGGYGYGCGYPPPQGYPPQQPQGYPPPQPQDYPPPPPGYPPPG
ncbi:MAG: hypothetical protein ACRD0A_13265 [Acidimicrobiales bacterium]